MDKKNKEEQELLSALESLLAGKDVRLGPEAGEDTRLKLQAAQKIVECGANPSPEFQKKLKSRLVNKMAAQEVEAKGRQSYGLSPLEFFKHLIPASPVWRTAAATVTVGLIGFLIVWAAGLLPLNQEPTITTPPILGTNAPAIVQAEPVSTVPITISVRDKAEIGIVLKNVSSSTIIIDVYPPAIEITSRDGDVVRTIASGQESVRLEPSGDVIYSFTWDLLDDNDQPVAPGTYSASVIGMMVSQDGATAAPFSFISLVQIVVQAG